MESRRQRITNQQKSELIERIISNYSIVACRFSSADGKHQKDEFWAELAANLNEMEGATKNVKGWQKSFYDIRNGVRAKFQKIRKHAYQTGGGGPLDIELDPIEEKLLNVLPSEHVDGLNSIEGGFGTDVIANVVEARAAQRVTSPVHPYVSASPTLDISFENSVLSQIPGPSGITFRQSTLPSVTIDGETSSPVDFEVIAVQAAYPSTPSPEVDMLSAPATDPLSGVVPTCQINFSTRTAPSQQTSARPSTSRTSRAQNLYRTSLARNSQQSLKLQNETLKELRRSNKLKQELLEFLKGESHESERRHRESMALLNEIKDTVRHN